MKTLFKLPISFVKVIVAIAMLCIGIIILISVIIAYTDYKSLFTKKKEKTAET